MQSSRSNSGLTPAAGDGTVPTEAILSLARRGNFERMAKRRYQHPTPFREGSYWWIRPWIDDVVEGKLKRKQKRIQLAPAATPEREVNKIRDEYMRPLNQGL